MKTLDISEFKRVHYNPAQLRCLVQYPNKLVAIMGRGTGKSTGIIAPRMANCLIKMPYSNNGLLGRTFKQIKTRTLPGTVSGWKKLGYREYDPNKGGHFVIGAKCKDFPLPDEAPSDWENCIHWFTGAIVSMSSQDRKNDSNGLNLQSLHNDESKLIDYEDLVESIIPTLRGMPKYKDLVEYRMQTYTSDMPTTPQSQWLLKAELEMDLEKVRMIFLFQNALQELRKKWYTAATSTRVRIEYEMASINRRIHLLRLGSKSEKNPPHMYFAEASSFENIDMLTPEYLKIQKRNLPDFVFNTSILNRRPKGVEISKMFYPQLNNRHFYDGNFDYNYYDQFVKSIPEEKDLSIGDLDCDKQQPLDLTIDWGGNINSLLVCQYDSDAHAYRFLKEFFALQPEYIKHLIEKFCKYYALHPTKEINMYYDRNGNTRVANSDETFAEYAQRLLGEAGWIVRLCSHEENPNHSDKFEFFTIALSGNEPSLPSILINRANCPNLEIALYAAKSKRVLNEIKKDKSSERQDSIPQTQATHVTDAFDYGYYTKFRDRIDGSIGTLVGFMLK